MLKKLMVCGALLVGMSVATSGVADEWMITAGGGAQPDSDQDHYTLGIDYRFYEYQRSKKQLLSIGASYTYVHADIEGAGSESWYAVSIYPQLTLLAQERSWGQPFFFVRALGPSYISDNRLGSRQQSEHFAFQAQVGLGAYIPAGGGDDWLVSASFKHFSNANLFDDNDGIDLPFVLSIGSRF